MLHDRRNCPSASLPSICRSSLYHYTPAPELQTAPPTFRPYLQHSQQNTNSWPRVAARPFYFHQLTNSWRNLRPLERCIGGLPAPNLLNRKPLLPLSICWNISNVLNQMWTLYHFLQPTLFVFNTLWTLLAKTPEVGGSMTNLISTPKRSTPKEESPEPPGGRQSGAWGLTARTGR
jgi:hypothetical protein